MMHDPLHDRLIALPQQVLDALRRDTPVPGYFAMLPEIEAALRLLDYGRAVLSRC
jgi:hypothetical protein